MAALASSDSDLAHGLLLFGHIGGVLLYVGGLAVYFIVLDQLRRARAVAQLSSLLNELKWGERSAIAGVIVILAAGLAMAGRQHLFSRAWIVAALILMVALAVIGRFTVDGRVARLRRALDAGLENRAFAELQTTASDPVMLAGCRVMAVLTLDIVFLMTVQPAAPATYVAVLVAVALAAAGYWFGRRPNTSVSAPALDSREPESGRGS